MEIRKSVSELMISELKNSPDWLDEAACAGVDVLNEGEELARLCRDCPVFAQCQQYSRNVVSRLRVTDDVVYAGESAKEVRKQWGK